MATMTLVEVAERQMRRVFGAATVEPDAADGSLVRAAAEGWPDASTYRTERLIETLRRFPAGHGTTEDGDREVCRALEESGASISSHWA